MSVDWLTSSTKQRKDLYDAVTRLIKLRELTWDQLYEEALGKRPGSVSAAFNENFRKGKISGANAALVYRFLTEKRPHAIPALLEATSTARAFREFLLYYRRLGALEILPEIIGEPFAAMRLGPEFRDHPFEAVEPITFRLRLPFICPACCALNWSNDGWYPLALEEAREYELADQAPPPHYLRGLPFIKAVTQGFQTITTLAPTKAEAKRRWGENAFVFIAADDELLSEITASWQRDQRIQDHALDQIAERFALRWYPGWCVAQVNAKGISSFRDI